MSNNQRYFLASVLIGAGILHFVVLSERLAASIPTGILFILLGVMQIVLAGGLLFSKQNFWFYAAGYSSAFLLILFVANQLAAGHVQGLAAEHLGIATVARKILEITAAVFFRVYRDRIATSRIY